MPAASRPILFVSGPVSGFPDLNLPTFRSVVGLAERLGYRVVWWGQLLHDEFGGDTSLPSAVYLRSALRRLLAEECTHIALLPGWDRSTGASAEAGVALALGLQFLDPHRLVRTLPPAEVTICAYRPGQRPGDPLRPETAHA
jgi:hypothetical protein